MTREEFTKQLKQAPYMEDDSWRGGALWAFDLLSKQHQEEVKELIDVMEAFRDRMTWYSTGVSCDVELKQVLSKYHAKRQTSGEGK